MEIIGGYDIPTWGILLTIATILAYIYLTWTFDTWSKQGVKGHRPLPLLGNIHTALLAGNFMPMDLDTVKIFGKISGSYRSRVPILNVADPEYLRLTMVKNFNSMPNTTNQTFGGIADLFMTTLTDDHWKHVRAAVSPTFTSGKLKLLKPRIDDCADRFVQYLKNTDGQPFPVNQFCGGYTMDTISSTAFGIELDSQSNPEHPMLLHANSIMGNSKSTGLYAKLQMIIRIVAFVFCPGFLLKHLLKIGISIFDVNALKYFEEVTEKIISDRGAEGTKQKDFVQLCVNQLIDDPQLSDPETKVDKFGLLWSTKGLTKDEIIANAIIFFLGGYDTTATSMQFILYELAMNIPVQEKAYAEAKENMSGDVATYEELSKMEYIDWVINEAMRLYPAAPRIERLVSKDTTIEGIHLPAGSMVSAMVYAIHHDPEIWPEPELFDPERFAPENREGRHQYAWIPFGLGNRNCIGMRLGLLNMKIAIVKIITNFILEPCEDTPEKPLKFARNFRMDPETAIKLKVRPRQTQPVE